MEAFEQPARGTPREGRSRWPWGRCGSRWEGTQARRARVRADQGHPALSWVSGLLRRRSSVGALASRCRQTPQRLAPDCRQLARAEGGRLAVVAVGAVSIAKVPVVRPASARWWDGERLIVLVLAADAPAGGVFGVRSGAHQIFAERILQPIMVLLAAIEVSPTVIDRKSVV